MNIFDEVQDKELRKKMQHGKELSEDDVYYLANNEIPYAVEISESEINDTYIHKLAIFAVDEKFYGVEWDTDSGGYYGEYAAQTANPMHEVEVVVKKFVPYSKQNEEEIEQGI